MDILVSFCTPSKLWPEVSLKIDSAMWLNLHMGIWKGEFCIEAFCCLMTSVHSMLEFWRNSTINTLYLYNRVFVYKLQSYQFISGTFALITLPPSW